jgi:hypothetical protein
MAQDPREKRSIFVIMPFSSTPTRSKADLTAFFQTNLKDRIEGDATLEYRYVVTRSADQFLVTETIISSLYDSDVLLCDLSGEQANPNVMFELGVRLAVSNKPVIMFREAHASNKPIFDISTYYIHSYSPLRYKGLEDFIISKLRVYEDDRELFQSPVLKTLQHAPSVIFRIREGETFRHLRMLMEGIQSVGMRFGGDIHSFLKSRVPYDVPDKDTTTLFQFIVERKAELEKLEWTSFVVQPVRVPALEAYLVDPVIAGFFPAEVEADFTIYAECFFDSVLNFGLAYPANGMPHVVLMLREIMLFKQMTLQLIGYLLNQPPGNQKFIDDFYHYFRQTQVSKEVRKTKSIISIHDPNRRDDKENTEQSASGDATTPDV